MLQERQCYFLDSAFYLVFQRRGYSTKNKRERAWWTLSWRNCAVPLSILSLVLIQGRSVAGEGKEVCPWTVAGVVIILSRPRDMLICSRHHAPPEEKASWTGRITLSGSSSSVEVVRDPQSWSNCGDLKASATVFFSRVKHRERTCAFRERSRASSAPYVKQSEKSSTPEIFRQNDEKNQVILVGKSLLLFKA